MKWSTAVKAIATRPRLWPTAIRQLLMLAPTGWWKRWPFVPLPAEGYMAFRMTTAYGAADHPPAADDFVTYLSWCRDWRRQHG